MTGFGKLLVLVNLVLSGVMCFWALVLWANNTDHSTKAPKDGQGGGLLGQRKARITEIQAIIPQAERSWRTTRTVLLYQEDLRKADRVWYTQELQHLLTGATDAMPCREVDIDEVRALAKLDPTGRPVMKNAKDRAGAKNLRALSYYNGESARLQKELEVVDGKPLVDKDGKVVMEGGKPKMETKGKFQEQADLDIKLTNEIAGTADMKGLQHRLVDERKKRDGIVAEQLIVEPLAKVAEVDTFLLLRRRETNEERIKELLDHLRRKYNVEVAARR